MMVQSKVLIGLVALAATAGAQVPNLSARVTSSGSLAANVPPRYATVLEADSDAPPLAREFRGVWIATVDNIDWPSKPGLPVDSQKAELLALLDRAESLRLNAVVFQVRPAADALYKSSLEPWSVYLTGQNGRAPSPEWDPLAFAIEESHKRGMELHAWFNPYRARYRGDRGTLSSRHISRTHPALVKRYGPYLWMDPGESAVRQHTTRVIMDVVRRYDIDGVHIDDYFYPYQERDRRGRIIPFPDNPSWTKYRRAGGKLDRNAWRRNNVDVLVEHLYGEIKKAKPWVKFGISPFGIWRPGYPAPIRGLDAYEALYADSRRWLVEGWLDYFAPQLYWAVGAPAQSYPLLLAWWADQNHLGRHLWPGNGTFKVTTTGSQRWQSREVLQQITLTREQPGAGGNIHFNMTSLVESADSLAHRLAAGPYQVPALVPASPWLTTSMPVAPTVTHSSDDGRLTLRISSATGSAATTPRWWLVRARYGDGWRAELTAATSSVVTLGPGDDGLLPDYVVVNAIGRAGLESEPVRIVVN